MWSCNAPHDVPILSPGVDLPVHRTTSCHDFTLTIHLIFFIFVFPLSDSHTQLFHTKEISATVHSGSLIQTQVCAVNTYISVNVVHLKMRIPFFIYYLLVISLIRCLLCLVRDIFFPSYFHGV